MTRQFDSALHLMEVQGGSFVRSLAACYYVADSANKRILRTAFATYFDEYEARFASMKETASQRRPLTLEESDREMDADSYEIDGMGS